MDRLRDGVPARHSRGGCRPSATAEGWVGRAYFYPPTHSGSYNTYNFHGPSTPLHVRSPRGSLASLGFEGGSVGNSVVCIRLSHIKAGMASGASAPPNFRHNMR